MPTAQVCREHGTSAATFYKWKAKFGGMNVGEAQRLRQLEVENAKLKRLVASTKRANGVILAATSPAQNGTTLTRHASLRGHRCPTKTRLLQS